MGKVIIVDDESEVVTVLSEYVKIAGFMPMKTNTMFEAISAIKAAPTNIDCLIVDYKMPVLNGVDVIMQARHLKHDLPVIMVSGFIDEDKLAPLFKIGNFWFVDKPIEKVPFINILRTALKNVAKAA